MKVVYLLPFIIGVFLYAEITFAENAHPGCGYASCPKTDPKKLNVHLLPFSLNHVGYTTPMDVFYNTYAKIQINSVIASLMKNSTRRFAYFDVMFLWKWWQSQNETNRELLKSLINEGRFEIANGGWSSIDEAVTYYQSIIDHYTWSFRRLNDSFGSCARPKVGWQIASYSHSREHASLFAQFGFDGTYITHIEPNDRHTRYAMKTAEFVWDTNPSLGKSSHLFTALLSYSEVLRTFCYDALCHGRIPIIDDPLDINYNVKSRATLLMSIFKDLARKHKTNNINIMLGGGNQYTIAELWYSNFDKIKKYINEKNGTRFNVFYSTPSCYIKALHDQNATWALKTNDFIPYNSDHHSFHNGYYSSKPSIKYLERKGNNFLQVAKQLAVLSDQSDNKDLQSLREMMAMMQTIHAVTGNHVVPVGANLVKKFHDSILNTTHMVSSALNKLILKKESNYTPEFRSCLSLNISACPHSSENKKFVVTVYNPTSQLLTTYVRLPVQKGTYDVKDYIGMNLVTQMLPIPEAIQRIPGRTSNAVVELVFAAENVPALGFKSFYVSQKSDEAPVIQPSFEPTIGIEDVSKISVNSNGRIFVNSVKEMRGFELQQSFHYYESAKSDSSSLNKVSSGAIIFKPKFNYSKEITGSATFQIYRGPIVEEIHHVVNEWVSQVIRVYNNTDHIEFDWLIGPIPIELRKSKEVVAKYTSNLKNQHEFYTDSNGRGMIARKTKLWPNYKLRQIEPIASNYYPVTTKIAIEDKRQKGRMAVLVDRSEGGSSIGEGEIELMLHRRVTTLDHVGIGVPTKDMAYGVGVVARGKHYLSVNNLTDVDDAIMEEKKLAVEINNQPWLFFTPVNETFEEWHSMFKMKSNDVISMMPMNVRILTLEPWKDGEVLLRLEHLLEDKETIMNSGVVQINLKDLFNDFTIISVQETTLGANQWINDKHRLNWTSELPCHHKLQWQKHTNTSRPSSTTTSRPPSAVASRPLSMSTSRQPSTTTSRQSSTTTSRQSSTTTSRPPSTFTNTPPSTFTNTQASTSTNTLPSTFTIVPTSPDDIKSIEIPTKLPSIDTSVSPMPEDMKPVEFSATEASFNTTETPHVHNEYDSFIIHLKPMEIRTFILKITHAPKTVLTTEMTIPEQVSNASL